MPSKSPIRNPKSLVPTLERFLHLGFGVDSQSVGDAVDVIEIGNDFDRVQDVSVGEAVLA